jgi:SAM-dependent methyltransferase
VASKLNNPEVYESALAYWPCAIGLERIEEEVIRVAPRRGVLIDFMCGPGLVLSRIARKRPDLSLIGVDIDCRQIAYASSRYPNIRFEKGNILDGRDERYDVALCTGALHHVPYEKQALAIANIAMALKPGAIAFASDCYIPEYKDEMTRKRGAARLGHSYLQYAIGRGAPAEVLEATVEILRNDVLGKEWKTSISKRRPIFKRCFAKVEEYNVWPSAELRYGDYFHRCTARG